MNRYAAANVSAVFAALVWGIAPVAIRYLSDDYGPFTQAFVRYSSATLFLLALVLLFQRREFLLALRQWAPLMGVSLFNVCGMIGWTFACYETTATMAQLITKLHLVFVVVMSYLLFHEERRVIRHPRFLVGTAMGLAGVVAVLVRDPAASLVPDFNWAVLVLVLVAALWAGYAVSAKHMVTGLHPVALFAVVGLYCSVVLGIFMLVFERPVTLAGATPWMTLVCVASGVIPIGMGHSAYHFGQKVLGAAFCSSILLLTPFVANAAGVFLWDDERMTWLQWAGTAVLLTGSFLVIQAGRAVHAAAVLGERIAPEA